MKSFKTLNERKEKSIVFSFGRMSPPTIGHGKLMDVVRSTAKKEGADHLVVLSHTHDNKKNPLSGPEKLGYAKKFFPHTNISLASPKSPSFLTQLSDLNKKGYSSVHMVVGADRVADFEKTLKHYNGQFDKNGNGYKFNHITVSSAGDRDPDAEGVEGMSASKMREFAKKNDFKSFLQGIPHHVGEKIAKHLFNSVRSGLSLKESVSDQDLYYGGVLFPLDSYVIEDYSGRVGKVVFRGPNYVNVDFEGQKTKAWIGDLSIYHLKEEEEMENNKKTLSSFRANLPKPLVEQDVEVIADPTDTPNKVPLSQYKDILAVALDIQPDDEGDGTDLDGDGDAYDYDCLDYGEHDYDDDDWDRDMKRAYAHSDTEDGGTSGDGTDEEYIDQGEQLGEVAPPGREKQVKTLKKKYPNDEGRAFAIAWAQYNKSKNESVNESISDIMMVFDHADGRRAIMAHYPKTENTHRVLVSVRNPKMGGEVKSIKFSGKNLAMQHLEHHGFQLSSLHESQLRTEAMTQFPGMINANHKVGDIVMVNQGPHKNVPHSVIHVHPNGFLNLRPFLIKGAKNHYRLGAVQASPDQVRPVVESVIDEGAMSEIHASLPKHWNSPEINHANSKGIVVEFKKGKEFHYGVVRGKRGGKSGWVAGKEHPNLVQAMRDLGEENMETTETIKEQLKAQLKEDLSITNEAKATTVDGMKKMVKAAEDNYYKLKDRAGTDFHGVGTARLKKAKARHAELKAQLKAMKLKEEAVTDSLDESRAEERSRTRLINTISGADDKTFRKAVKHFGVTVGRSNHETMNHISGKISKLSGYGLIRAHNMFVGESIADNFDQATQYLPIATDQTPQKFDDPASEHDSTPGYVVNVMNVDGKTVKIVRMGRYLAQMKVVINGIDWSDATGAAYRFNGQAAAIDAIQKAGSGLGSHLPALYDQSLDTGVVK